MIKNSCLCFEWEFEWSTTVPQQVALTAVTIQVSACVWVTFVTNVYIQPVVMDSHIGCVFICGVICLLKNSQPRHPQREALMNKRIISVSIWGDLNVISASSFTACHICYVQPPQQVALTVCNAQVDAQVRSILHAWREPPSLPMSWYFFWHLLCCVPAAVEVVSVSQICPTFILKAAISSQLRPLFWPGFNGPDDRK